MFCFGLEFSYRGFEFKSLMQILLFPARREADAPSRCIIRIPDKRPKKPEAAAPIPVQKQDIGHTSDTIPAPGRCINRNDLYGFISWRAMAERQKTGA